MTAPVVLQPTKSQVNLSTPSDSAEEWTVRGKDGRHYGYVKVKTWADARDQGLVVAKAVNPDATREDVDVERSGGMQGIRRALVTGGAGGIGCHLVEELVARGVDVIVYDNLSFGRRENLAKVLASPRKARLYVADVLDGTSLRRAMKGCDVVFHLASDPRILMDGDRPETDLHLQQGTEATWSVLEAMRRTGVKRIVFASSASVYGNTPGPCREDGPTCPVSLYATSKSSAEGLISAFVECYGISGTVLRFSNIVGARASHGCMYDFLQKLKANPARLKVLGSGEQTKPFVSVRDCVDGILFAVTKQEAPYEVFNVAPEDATSVREIAEMCRAASPYPEAKIAYGAGAKGWPGDCPHVLLSPEKMASLGWTVRRSSRDAAKVAIDELAKEVFGS